MIKYCALLSLCAGVSLAANFITGQGARLVIGQPTFTQQDFGASETLLGGVGGVAWANGQLFIADSNRPGFTPINNRVLIMDTTGFPKPTDEIPPFIARCPVCLGKANVVLGQPNFTTITSAPDVPITASSMRVPTAVATDGRYLAVADTVNNRVLLWNNIPANNGTPADVVLGQSSFTTVKTLQAGVVDAKTLRAPQGVWIQNGRLYVADTQDHRVLIWNNMPTQNGQAPDLVLGQINFNVSAEPDLTKATLDAESTTLLNPVSVTSDGTHLFVTDLGHNRVLIWNTLPTRNTQPADVVVGQKDFTTAIGNDTPELCKAVDFNRDGIDDTDPTTGDKIYPGRCEYTMDFPRFALSDGKRLFIADGGNDRVLIYNTIPTTNAAPADIVLGQTDFTSSAVSSVTDLFHPLLRQSAADIIPTPTSLAWDGTNLYVTDPSNRRVMVFSEGEPLVPINGVRNSGSREIFALGSIGVMLGTKTNTDGTIVNLTITAGDVVTITLGTAADRTYTYTVKTDDTVELILQGISDAIQNANGGNGDPEVFAQYQPILGIVKLQAKVDGAAGNDIVIDAAVNDGATIVAATSGSFMQGGESATVIAPGTLVQMVGTNLASSTVAANLNDDSLPLDLGNVQAYFDGIRSPLLYVSGTQVNAQVPLEVLGSNNISFFLRIQRPDGSVTVTNAIAVPIDEENPGLFAAEGTDPRTAIAFHASSYATGTITVDGGIEQGDTATVTVEDRSYKYTVKGTDTLDSIRDTLVAMINSNPEERVVAYPVGAFHRFQLRSKIGGPEGEGTTYSATSDQGDNDSVFLVLSANSAALCCGNIKDAPITALNPAVPGETIYMFGTGLGPVDPQRAFDGAVTGSKYIGPALNNPRPVRFDGQQGFVSSLAGGSTADVISAGLEVGGHGIYRIVLQLSPGLIVNGDTTQLTISQFIYTSNTVNLPVRNPSISNLQPTQ